MKELLKALFHKERKVSVVKKLFKYVDNPEDYIVTVEVINDAFVVRLHERKEPRE